MNGLHLSFSRDAPGRLLRTLILVELGGVLIFIASSMFDHEYMASVLRITREATLFTWFTSVQLFTIGLLFLYSGNWPGIHRVVRPGFLIVVGIGFLFLSIDETSEVHELITQRLKHYEWSPRLFRGNHGIWIPIYLGIFTALVISGFRTGISMLKAYTRQTLIMLAGFSLAVLGGVVLEAVGYVYFRSLNRGFIYTLELSLEEFLEMAGMSIVLYGVLLCAAAEGPRTGLAEGPGSSSA